VKSSFLLDGSNILAIAIMEATIMGSIRVRQHVGQIVFYQLQLLETSDRSIADLYGICADDPITLDDQGISEVLDD